jgi:hypothetical protein
LGNNSKNVNIIKNLTWGKNDQHIKIYLPCNFEVNLIAHLGNNSKMGNQIYFKSAGYVDLDMLNMFAVSTYHLSLIVFEIKDEKH